MTDETNGADMTAAEAAAVALNQPAEGQKDYLPEKVETPEAETPGEDVTAAQPEPEAEAPSEPKPKKTAKDRIDELTWRLREAERREAQLLDRIGGRQPAQEAHQPEPQSDGRPDPEGYEYGVNDPQYIEDLTDWKAEQAVTRTLAQREQRQTVQSKFDTFQTKAGELYPDGEPEGLQAFRQLPALPPAVIETILASDIGPKIAEHLGDNPREFERLSGLSPALQARELTLLETRLSASAAPASEMKPPPKTVTAAPEPPPQARGAGGRFTVAPDTNDFAAFEKQFLGG